MSQFTGSDNSIMTTLTQILSWIWMCPNWRENLRTKPLVFYSMARTRIFAGHLIALWTFLGIFEMSLEIRNWQDMKSNFRKSKFLLGLQLKSSLCPKEHLQNWCFQQNLFWSSQYNSIKRPSSSAVYTPITWCQHKTQQPLSTSSYVYYCVLFGKLSQ